MFGADVFAPRPVVVRIPPIVDQQHQRSGTSDDMLLELAAAGLSLRQVAERAGLSHETVRRRLGITAPGSRQFCSAPFDTSAIVLARKAVGTIPDALAGRH
jgi:hypothetical protein